MEKLKGVWNRDMEWAWAAMDLDKVKKLVKQGVDLFARNAEGETYLHILCKTKTWFGSNPDLIRWLVGQGIDVNVQDNYGNTPLMCSALNGDIYAVDTLFELGADAKIKTKIGWTALHSALTEDWRYAGYEDCVKRILEHGADINAQDKYGRTPLMIADEDHTATWGLDYLLDNGADWTLEDIKGKTVMKQTRQNNFGQHVDYWKKKVKELQAKKPDEK